MAARGGFAASMTDERCGLSPVFQMRATERSGSNRRAVGGRERLRSGVEWSAAERAESGPSAAAVCGLQRDSQKPAQRR